MPLHAFLVPSQSVLQNSAVNVYVCGLMCDVSGVIVGVFHLPLLACCGLDVFLDFNSYSQTVVVYAVFTDNTFLYC